MIPLLQQELDVAPQVPFPMLSDEDFDLFLEYGRQISPGAPQEALEFALKAIWHRKQIRPSAEDIEAFKERLRAD